MTKREFIKTLGLAGLAGPALGKDLGALLPGIEQQDAGLLAADDAFWDGIRKAYYLKPDYINLENGYYCMMPQPTLEAYVTRLRQLNAEASWYMRTRLADDKVTMRHKMAEFLGCPAEELVITRNTTESMNTVICGFDWKPGDEAVMAEQDYGSMLDMFRQQARRHGIVNRIISIPNHPESDDAIVALYEKAITPRTRLLMVCHMINITGQILPVRKICDMAHSRGVKVVVDGAHAIGHFQFDLNELGCDYYASSLHKWLSVPLGAGILYVRKDNIKDLWPLYAESGYPEDDIRKLNHTGTHPMHTELSIADAIDFHHRIGGQRKEARLRFLQQYWTSRVRGLKRIVLNTPEDPARSCGIANAGISGMSPADLARQLLERYKIWTVAIDYANVHGCRITPNVYTTTQELDVLVEALKELSR